MIGWIVSAAIAMETVALAPEGPAVGTVVVLPGNDLCAPFYEPLGRQLAERGLAVTLTTLPGYGGTEPLDPVTWDGLLAEVTALVRAQARPVALVGHSLGGLTAFLAAAQLGDDLDHLVLMEAPVVPWRWLAARGADRYDRQVIEGDRGGFDNHGPGYLRIADPGAFPAEAMAAAIACRRTSDPGTPKALIADGPDLYPLPYDQVLQPTLLIRGDASGAMLRLGAWDLRRRLHDARIEVIEGAAHWLANEQDAALASAIAEFVAP